MEEQNSILYLYSSIWRWSDSEPERVESIKKFCNFFDTILRFSFFDPDPESSCFGVSHYNGNVSWSSLLSTSCPGFFLSFSSLLSLFLALVRRETGRGVGRVRGERSWKRGYFFSLLTLQSVELWSNRIKVVTPFSDWEPGMGEFSGTATFWTRRIERDVLQHTLTFSSASL